MSNKTLVNGLVIMAIGFLASSLSSFIGHFTLFGTATDFVSGFFDGLAVGLFGVAIFILLRSRSLRQE